MRYRLILLLGMILLTKTALLAVPYDSLRLEVRGEQSVVIHEVQAGETIFGLSRRYGAAVDEIKDASSLSGNNLTIGQLLSIPVVPTETIEPVDTLGRYITHEVVAGETLYGISRQYDLTVAELKRLNDMTGNALELGAKLIVGKEEGTLAQEVIEEEVADKIETVVDSLPRNTHVVGAGETIYSIARRYGVDVQELREINDLESNYISIDQQLQIPFEVVGQEQVDTVNLVVTSPDTVITKVEDAIISSDTLQVSSKYGNSDRRDTTNLVPGQVVEEGFAMKIENAPKTRKYLALHRTVPIGTIMQVRNQMNNQSIFVRVVGKLPNTGPNKNVLIRLTRQAFDRLGAIDPKIPVEVAYMRE